jgi:hypothetical protein
MGNTELAPLVNGSNGRAADGRFAVGNPGGPGGSAFAKRSAQLRQTLIDAVSEQDIRDVATKLVERAKAGDVDAARLLFDRLLGKPVMPVAVKTEPADEIRTVETVTLNQAIEQLKRATPEEREIVRRAMEIMRKGQREANAG